MVNLLGNDRMTIHGDRNLDRHVCTTTTARWISHGKWYATEHINVSLEVINILEEDAVQTGANQDCSPNSGFTEGFPLYEYETSGLIFPGLTARF